MALGVYRMNELVDNLPPAVVNVTVGEILVWAVFLGGFLTVLTQYRKHVSPVFKSIRLFLEDWNGEAARPGFPRRPGVNERLANVEKELSPGSDTSLHSKVEWIARQQANHQLAISELQSKVGDVDHKVDSVDHKVETAASAASSAASTAARIVRDQIRHTDSREETEDDHWQAAPPFVGTNVQEKEMPDNGDPA